MRGGRALKRGDAVAGAPRSVGGLPGVSTAGFGAKSSGWGALHPCLLVGAAGFPFPAAPPAPSTSSLSKHRLPPASLRAGVGVRPCLRGGQRKIRSRRFFFPESNLLLWGGDVRAPGEGGGGGTGRTRWSLRGAKCRGNGSIFSSVSEKRNVQKFLL